MTTLEKNWFSSSSVKPSKEYGGAAQENDWFRLERPLDNRRKTSPFENSFRPVEIRRRKNLINQIGGLRIKRPVQ